MTITTKTTKYDGEYRVRLFINGEYQAGADYFTDDKQDARDTAAHMQANGTYSDKTTDFAIAEQADYNAEAEAETETETETETDDETVLYDVCNDYSLSVADNPVDARQYNAQPTADGIIYRCKRTGEVHYYRGVDGLDGQYL